MKNKKSSKSVSKVKRKKWKIFSKENLKGGLGGVVVLSVVSFWLLSVPCELIGGIFPFCFSMISFALINFLGLTISKMINLYGSSNYYIWGIILSAPFYYFVGIFSKGLVNKIKK